MVTKIIKQNFRTSNKAALIILQTLEPVSNKAALIILHTYYATGAVLTALYAFLILIPTIL